MFSKNFLDDVPVITREQATKGASALLQGLYPDVTTAHKALAREYLDRTYDPRKVPSIYTQELIDFLWKTEWKVWSVKITHETEFHTSGRK